MPLMPQGELAGMTHLCLNCLNLNNFKAEKEAMGKQWKEPET